MSIDYQALKAELDAGHPVTGAYNADENLAADELNAINIEVNRASMTGDELLSATNSADYAALTDAKKAQWLSITLRESVDPFDATIVEIVKDIWGQPSTTLTNLNNARTELVSRTSQLGFGRDTLTYQHVIEARNQP